MLKGVKKMPDGPTAYSWSSFPGQKDAHVTSPGARTVSFEARTLPDGSSWMVSARPGAEPNETTLRPSREMATAEIEASASEGREIVASKDVASQALGPKTSSAGGPCKPPAVAATRVLQER